MQTSMQIKIKLGLLWGDIVVISFCLALATFIHFGDASFLYDEYGTAWVLCLLTYPLSLYLTRSYEVRPEASSAENLQRPLLGVMLAAGTTSVIFFFAPDIRFGRGIFAIANMLLVFLLLMWRLGIFVQMRGRRLNILLMGNESAVEMARQLIRELSPLSQTCVWQPGAELGNHPAEEGSGANPGAESSYDLLILAGHSLDAATLSKAASLRLKGVMVWNLPRLWSEFAERVPARFIDERWVATAEGFRALNEQSFQVIKRLLDLSLALAGLLASLPILGLAAIAIKIQDGGKILYSQDRVGKGGNVFRVHKLRTMVDGAEGMTGPVWASPGDPRVTPVGRWLRKLRIDEIPQVWNVLKGEMSFVGPRPERPVFVETLEARFPIYSLRHLVRPGITGWAQVRCPYGASEDDALRKLEYDLYYLQNASLLFDLRIILKTIPTVVSAYGSW